MRTIHEKITEWIFALPSTEDIFFQVQHVIDFYNYEAKLRGEGCITYEEVLTSIGKLRQEGYRFEVKKDRFGRYEYRIIYKKEAPKEESKKTPRTFSFKEQNAMNLLGLSSKTPLTETDIKNAFIATVKKHATGNGGYNTDMDNVVKAKEFLLAQLSFSI